MMITISVVLSSAIACNTTGNGGSELLLSLCHRCCCSCCYCCHQLQHSPWLLCIMHTHVFVCQLYVQTKHNPFSLLILFTLLFCTPTKMPDLVLFFLFFVHMYMRLCMQVCAVCVCLFTFYLFLCLSVVRSFIRSFHT